MNSHFHIPHEAHLKNVIRNIWQTDGFPEYERETIIPRGIVEIIFNFSEAGNVYAKFNDIACQLSKCFINGFNNCPVYIEMPGQLSFFGVQFHPLAIKKILGVQVREFANTAIDLTLVDKSFLSLWHQLAEKKSFIERVNTISCWMMQKIVELDPKDKILNNFLCEVLPEDLTVPQLANTLYYSPRHLSRKIYELTEMNTEEFLLYKKFLQAVQLTHFTPLSLTQIAYQSRFSDQSHFIRSFKSLAGMTPGDYRKSKGRLPGHIFDNVR